MKLKITIDGKVYEVDVEASDTEQRRTEVPLPSAPSHTPLSADVNPNELTPQADVAAADESKVCRSPVAGVVVKVTAQSGESIQTNDLLMVLEAMKMETNITSPVSGKVARVNAAVGDSVHGGQVLVEFE